jgi:hypothetical protein
VIDPVIPVGPVILDGRPVEPVNDTPYPPTPVGPIGPVKPVDPATGRFTQVLVPSPILNILLLRSIPNSPDSNTGL